MTATQGIRAKADTGPAQGASGSIALKPDQQAAQDQMASKLLAFESDLRALNTEAELFAHWCNETRRFLNFRQAFLLHSKVRGTKPRLVCATLSLIHI